MESQHTLGQDVARPASVFMAGPCVAALISGAENFSSAVKTEFNVLKDHKLFKMRQ